MMIQGSNIPNKYKCMKVGRFYVNLNYDNGTVVILYVNTYDIIVNILDKLLLKKNSIYL